MSKWSICTSLSADNKADVINVTREVRMSVDARRDGLAFFAIFPSNVEIFINHFCHKLMPISSYNELSNVNGKNCAIA